MNITYVKGDATKPVGDDYDTRLILHICNDEGGWGSGFVLGLNKTFGVLEGAPRTKYSQWYHGEINTDSDKTVTGPFKLGQVQFCKQKNGEVVVNMIAQSTPGGYNGFAPIRYQSLEECLLRIRDKIKAVSKKGHTVSLHGPRFGAGLAGGDWNEIEKILLRVFKDVDIEMTIYDWDGK